MVAPELIDTPDALGQLLQRLESGIAAGQTVAIDTEFHSEFRYRPRLMLIQLRLSDQAPVLVDPRALGDLRPLGRVLSQGTLLFHAPGQDLPLLQNDLGLRPQAVIDTQVLAGFAALGFPRSLGELIREVLDIALPKQSTLSDWKQRPLSAQQMAYAADDVLHLHALEAALTARLSPESRAWAAECTLERMNSALSPVRFDQAWRRLGAARVLRGADLELLQAIAAWREQHAFEANQPPHQVLSNGLLLDLVRRRPQSTAQMAENRRFPKRVMRDHGEPLLALIQAHPERYEPPDRRQEASQNVRELAFKAAVARRGFELGIAPELLTPGGDRVTFRDMSRLSGWRKTALRELNINV